MVSFEINGHRWSKVPDAASCWTLTTAVAACIWVMRALMSVKHSVLDLTSFKRCLFNIPSCSYCFHIDDPTKTVFVSEISGAGVSCRAGLTAWKRRRRSIHVGLLEKVGWAEGQWEWERERGGCSIEGATGILFCPSKNESGSYEWPTESVGWRAGRPCRKG